MAMLVDLRGTTVARYDYDDDDEELWVNPKLRPCFQIIWQRRGDCDAGFLVKKRSEDGQLVDMFYFREPLLSSLEDDFKGYSFWKCPLKCFKIN